MKRKSNIKKIIFSILIMLVIIIFPALGIGIYNTPKTQYCTEQTFAQEQMISNNILTSESIELNTIETAAMPIEETFTELYTTTGLNIRKGPGLDYDIVTTVSINSLLKTVDGTEENNWIKIKYNDEYYYVNTNYLSKEKTIIKTSSRGKTTDTRQNQQEPASAGDLVGYFTLTYYCPCTKCCGSYANGITAWGTTATAGKTIATSSQFAFGTKLIINGHEYTVEDRGGAIKGNKIDIYVDSHSEALKLGKKTNVPVYYNK